MNKKEHEYNIIVLLSCYNGAKYIEEQIDSILNQKNVDVHLIIRDDGSTDATVNVLSQYLSLPNIDLWQCSNVGVVSSFISLIDNAPEAEFYALADQDDIWYEDKLYRAISMFDEKDSGIPVLYAANQNHVNGDKEFLHMHFEKEPQISLMHEVFRNYMSGCTMVFNSSFLKILRDDDKLRELAYLRMHDSWMMLLALLEGKFIYDNKPVMDFRRHGNNASDGGIDSKNRFKTWAVNLYDIIFRNKKTAHVPSYTSKLIVLNYFDRLQNDEKAKLITLANYRNSTLERLKLLFSPSILKYANAPVAVAMLKVIFNRY